MPRNGKLSAREEVLDWSCVPGYFPEKRYWNTKREEVYHDTNDLEAIEMDDVFDYNNDNTPYYTPKQILKPNTKIYCDRCRSYVKFKSASNHLNTNRCNNRLFRMVF